MARDPFFPGDGFFNSPRMESPFRKGDLKYVILDLIKTKSRYGYEIIRVLEERSHGFYTPSPGVIYPILQYIDELGYVSVKERDGKKVYTITDEGRKFLKERKDVADEIEKHMKRHWDPEKAEPMAEVTKNLAGMGKLLRFHLHHADKNKIVRVGEIIAGVCKEIAEILENKK